ncbi:MAG: D-alanyl-D-alanine carboxypeptidase family protein [Bacillota bacterium]
MMKAKKMFWIGLFFLIAGAQRPSRAASAWENLGIKAKSACLIDASSGQVLYSKNPRLRVPPASITKIMSLIVIMDAIDDKLLAWDENVKVSREASQMGGSQIWLKEGEEMPVRDLVKAVAVVSANDASAALAEKIYGENALFVKKMNARGKMLGLTDTHFVNEHGLPDPGQYTSAYDVALMSRDLILRHPAVLRFTSIWIDSLRGGKSFLRNTNRLLKEYPGADGLKTGYTAQAGFCLSATAVQKDFRLISVVMGADTEDERLAETKKLLNYGFRFFDRVRVAEEGARAPGKVFIKGGRLERVAPVVKRDFAVLVPKGKGDLVETRIVQKKNLRAPVKKGAAVGALVAELEGRKLAEAPLVAPEKIVRANFLVQAWRWLRDLFFGWRKTRPAVK